MPCGPPSPRCAAWSLLLVVCQLGVPGQAAATEFFAVGPPAAAAPATPAAADDLAPLTQAATWAPLDLVASTFRFTYERRLASPWSLVLSPTFGLTCLNPDAPWLWLLGGDSVGVEVGGRYYLRGEAPRGLFLEPRLSWTHGFTFGIDRLAVHGHLGRQWLFGGGWAALASVGLRYHNDWGRRGSQSAAAILARDFDGRRGFAPELNVGIGRAF